MSSLNYHVASDKRKWTIVAIVLVLVIAAIVLMPLTDMFTNWNKYCLFGHDFDDDGFCIRCGIEKLDEVEPDKKDDKDTDKGSASDDAESSVQGGAVVTVPEEGEIEVSVMPLAGSSGVSGEEPVDSWTITVTKVKPASATNQNFDWSIRWKNADSSWSQDKNVEEYCTITPQSDGSKVATMRNLKDFGEQIEIVVTSRDVSELQKIILVDYVQRITGFTFKMPDVASETTSFTYQVESTAYTLAAEIELEFSKMELLDGFVDIYSDIVDTAISNFPVQNNSYDAYFIACLLSLSEPNIITMSLDEQYIDDVVGTFFSHGEGLFGLFLVFNASVDYQDVEMIFREDPNWFSKWFTQAVEAYSGNHATFDVNYKATYNGNVYSTGTQTVECRFDGSALHVSVEDFEMSTDHVII